ncbi:MAG: SDR family NAD(P)-dependent oxidoreductase [Dehalococcoidia bacterium]
MKDFAGKVAVVTGAASGMGLAFAHRFAEEGMNVVLADIESEPLAMAEAAVKAKGGGKTLALRTDVMSKDAVDRLADAAFKAFGNVHIVCNNAGVIASAANLRRPSWESSLDEWDWVLGVNLMGVVHGVRAFVPRMLENGEEGHIVNTASMAGMMSGDNAYNVSKFGVVCLTEGLYKQFKGMGARLSASVLCPGLIRTAILDAERNRPADLGAPVNIAELRADLRDFTNTFTAALSQGIDPAEVAQLVFESVRDDQFYIFPVQPGYLDILKVRLDDISQQRNPTMIAR